MTDRDKKKFEVISTLVSELMRDHAESLASNQYSQRLPSVRKGVLRDIKVRLKRKYGELGLEENQEAGEGDQETASIVKELLENITALHDRIEGWLEVCQEEVKQADEGDVEPSLPVKLVQELKEIEELLVKLQEIIYGYENQAQNSSGPASTPTRVDEGRIIADVPIVRKLSSKSVSLVESDSNSHRTFFSPRPMKARYSHSNGGSNRKEKGEAAPNSVGYSKQHSQHPKQNSEERKDTEVPENQETQQLINEQHANESHDEPATVSQPAQDEPQPNQQPQGE